MLHIKQTFIANGENTPLRLHRISVLDCWQQQQKRFKEMPAFVSENIITIKQGEILSVMHLHFDQWEGTNTKGCTWGSSTARLHVQQRDF